jgi:hypothetical protein
MKKYLMFLVASVLLIGGFNSCEKEDEGFKLEGTSWLLLIEDEETTINFLSGSQFSALNEDGDAFSGSWFFTDPILTLIVQGEKLTLIKMSDTQFSGKETYEDGSEAICTMRKK